MMKKLTAERCKKQIEEWQRMMSVSDVAVMVELNLQAYLIALPVLEQQEKQAEQQVDDDGWIEWKGGKCPVDGSVKVDVRFRNGEVDEGLSADGWVWLCSPDSNYERDIIAYRVIENNGSE